MQATSQRRGQRRAVEEVIVRGRSPIINDVLRRSMRRHKPAMQGMSVRNGAESTAGVLTRRVRSRCRGSKRLRKEPDRRSARIRSVPATVAQTHRVVTRSARTYAMRQSPGRDGQWRQTKGERPTPKLMRKPSPQQIPKPQNRCCQVADPRRCERQALNKHERQSSRRERESGAVGLWTRLRVS